MGLVVGFLFDAAIIGIVVAAMQEGEFPGWGPMIACVFAMGITANVLGHFLPGFLSLLALLPAALVGAFMISWLCEMPLRRAAKAAAIYLGIRIVASFVMMLLIGG